MTKLSTTGRVKYVPRQQRITIPVMGDDGILPPTVVEKEDFTQAHAAQILEFWNQLAKKDKSFNKDKAMLSTFTIEGDDSPIPTGLDSTEDHDDGENKEALQKELEKVSVMTVAQLKDYASENEIDLGDASAKADIVEAVITWVKANF